MHGTLHSAWFSNSIHIAKCKLILENFRDGGFSTGLVYHQYSRRYKEQALPCYRVSNLAREPMTDYAMDVSDLLNSIEARSPLQDNLSLNIVWQAYNVFDTEIHGPGKLLWGEWVI